jgi:hypothetical protein
MSVNAEVKGTLARLLATENLNVEHRAVPTAYFEVQNRTLCLPIWKNVSNNVYDLLVGHEVGHALYTPLNYVDAAKELPQDVLNVLEDVRVEKLMKRRYPGLSRSFFHGYTELDEKNFFELEGKDISKMSLIDRINIHYKIGVVGNRTIVPFERDEMQWVNRVSETETFDDILTLTKELVEYLKMKKEEQVNVEIPMPESSSGGGGDTLDQQDMEESFGPSSQNSDDQGQGSSTHGSDSDSEGGSTPVGGQSTPVGGKGGVDEFQSQTYHSLDKNQKQLVDQRAKNYVYVTLPTFDLNSTIVPNKTIFTKFNSWSKDCYKKCEKEMMESAKRYHKYRKDSIKTVNYLVKEFECKKAADQYARATTSRTGVLDTQKLHTYKFSDDIFKKITTVSDGKNHGLVFYLDWSGSMSNLMLSTVKQLYDLIWFCKKVSIPFRVYAFSDNSYNSYKFAGNPTQNKEGEIHVDKNFRLLEFISSKMNAKTLDKMMEYLFINADGFRGHGNYNYDFSLSGTPLVETIISTPQVVEKFKSEEKVQKVNVIYLTDGEAAYPTFNKNIERLGGIYDQPLYGGNKNYVLKDPKTRYQRKVEMDCNSITNEFVGYISNIVDYNLLGFRLCSKTEVRNQANYAGIDGSKFNDLEKEWNTNKSVSIPNCGFDELYLMQLPKSAYSYYSHWNPDEDDSESEIKVSGSASKSQLTTAFKKHMTNKMINKTILSKFVGQIA